MAKDLSPEAASRRDAPQVLLADDYALVRAGFRALLKELGIPVVAEASNGSEALELIKVHHPDLVLMDIAMPGINGLEAAALVASEYPGVKVLIISMHANAEYARRALGAGAAGYILKDSSAAELEMAVEAVTRGQVYLSPAVAKFIAVDYARGGEKSLIPLSPRQLEILQLIARGYTRKQIAQRLEISVKTYDTYRAQLMEQLDAHDAAGLVSYATRMGLLTPDP